MIAKAKTKPKPFETILVYSFSRFARNREDSIVYKSLLRKRLGISVVSITQPLSDGKEAIILEAMYEAMDEYYSVDLAENSIRGKLEKAERGEHQGNPPYGYIYNKNTRMLEIDPERAEVVKMIFKEYNNDPKMSIKRIVVKLNAMGIKTARGNLWSDRNINIILNNPAYIGKTRFCLGGMKRNWDNPNIQLHDGIHEPIVDLETFEEAQKRNRKRKELYFKYAQPNVKHEHWIRGILKCSDCGSTLVKIKVVSRKTAHFQCTHYIKGKCIHNHYIREDIIISAILEQIKKDYTEKIDINIVSKEENCKDDIEVILKLLKQLEAKEKRIKTAYSEGIDTLEEYKENKLNIQKEKSNLERELKKIEYDSKIENQKQQVYSKCANAYEILSDPNSDENTKYTISHELFDKIIYDKINQKITIYYK